MGDNHYTRKRKYSKVRMIIIKVLATGKHNGSIGLEKEYEENSSKIKS